MLHKRNSLGFTLIELMVVVAILGILLAIVAPAYSEYVKKARRSDAKSALMSASQAMERFYTENATYNGATLGSGATDIAKTSSVDGYYSLAFDSTPTAATACAATVTTNPSASSYRLCATPTGSQSGDTCTAMSMSQTGAKLPATGCW